LKKPQSVLRLKYLHEDFVPTPEQLNPDLLRSDLEADLSPSRKKSTSSKATGRRMVRQHTILGEGAVISEEPENPDKSTTHKQNNKLMKKYTGEKAKKSKTKTRSLEATTEARTVKENNEKVIKDGDSEFEDEEWSILQSILSLEVIMKETENSFNSTIEMLERVQDTIIADLIKAERMKFFD
jgi:hypothetical protein